jgi:hypothetical protein
MSFRDFARNDSQGHFAPFVCNDNPGAGYAWNKSRFPWFLLLKGTINPDCRVFDPFKPGLN